MSIFPDMGDSPGSLHRIGTGGACRTDDGFAGEGLLYKINFVTPGDVVPEIVEVLVVDIYMPDFKYWSSDKS